MTSAPIGTSGGSCSSPIGPSGGSYGSPIGTSGGSCGSSIGPSGGSWTEDSRWLVMSGASSSVRWALDWFGLVCDWITRSTSVMHAICCRIAANSLLTVVISWRTPVMHCEVESDMVLKVPASSSWSVTFKISLGNACIKGLNLGIFYPKMRPFRTIKQNFVKLK